MTNGAAQPGGLLKRFLARLIDGILVSIIGSIGIVAIFSPRYLSDILVTGLFTGVLMFVYFLAFEAGVGWTPGKKLLGLEVRGPGGAAKPDVKQAAIRNAWTLFPIIPFVGGLAAFIAIVVIAVTVSSSPTKQGKHDELAGGTEVVDR
ncbi:RDD family protein [Mycolicibacterium arenosum]|uniref:RDD family protein n=1 Tax=Mycolicibacterium arenosum TaxID=2952157 RepID=A0ABT1MA24_9MYCO|nr:RDD family protein [Mycolicibacterium sp. CAU 1645]MCP9276011.1 RDD family protein [Mycolicibacterium sp. CAU 1645]